MTPALNDVADSFGPFVEVLQMQATSLIWHVVDFWDAGRRAQSILLNLLPFVRPTDSDALEVLSMLKLEKTDNHKNEAALLKDGTLERDADHDITLENRADAKYRLQDYQGTQADWTDALN